MNSKGICDVCIKYDRIFCPLFWHSPVYIITCSAFEKIISYVTIGERVEILESHVKDLKIKYYKTYQTLYDGKNESRTEKLEKKIENLEAYNEHTFDAQLKENADITQENKKQIEKLEEKIKMLNKNQGQCFEKRGQFTKEISELKGKQDQLIAKWGNNSEDQLIDYFDQKISELKEDKEALHEAITNETKANLIMKDVLQKLKEKLKGKDLNAIFECFGRAIYKNQENLDEAFNRLEHHSSFYPRFKRIEKMLREHIKWHRSGPIKGFEYDDKKLAEQLKILETYEEEGKKEANIKGDSDKTIYCGYCGKSGYHSYRNKIPICFECIQQYKEGENSDVSKVLVGRSDSLKSADSKPSCKDCKYKKELEEFKERFIIDSKLPEGYYSSPEYNEEGEKTDMGESFEDLNPTQSLRESDSKPLNVPYCYQDKCVAPYKTPEAIKFLGFDFKKEGEKTYPAPVGRDQMPSAILKHIDSKPPDPIFIPNSEAIKKLNEYTKKIQDEIKKRNEEEYGGK